MTTGRPPLAFLVLFGVVLVGLVVLLGTMAFRALAGDDEEPATFAEQVRALPVVVDVETSSDRVVGTARTRTLESWVTLSPELTQDPARAGADLAGVSFGYALSHWSIDGLPSTAEVRYRGPLDEAPFRWWTESVAALADTDPEAALHCEVTDAALACEVQADDPGRARQALAGVDGSAIGAWLDAARPDEGERHGFSLTVGGETVTDPDSVG